MDFELVLYILTICSFAAFVHGSIGFGFPMLATPLLSLLTDVQTAIMLIIIPTVFINLVSIKSEGGFLEAIKKHFKLVVYTAFGSLLGTGILIYYESEVFKVILALAIGFYLITSTFKVNIDWIKKSPQFSKATFGLASGVMGGLTNVMAPTLIIYSIESGQTRREIIQSTNLCFLFGKLAQLVLFTISQSFTIETLYGSTFVIAVVLAFIPLGIKLKSFISEVFYKVILKVLLSCIALALVLQALG